MDRRCFTRRAGSAALSLPFVPAWTRTQSRFRQERPDSGRVEDPSNDGDFADSLVQGVARAYESPVASLADFPAGELFAMVGFAGEFDTPENASRGLEFIASSFAEDVEEQTVEVAVDPLGDERLGLETTYPAEVDTGVDEIVFGLLLVRKNHILQILIGVAATSPIEDVLAMAHHVDPRWPSDILWHAVPLPADLPEEMILTETTYWTLEDFGLAPEGDAPTPAPTREPLAEGALAFTVELRLDGPAMATDAEGAFCSGAGAYADVTAGATFRVLHLGADDELMTALLSPGMLQDATCRWQLAVLGLPPRDAYDFLVGDRSVGTARYAEITNGGVLVFEVSS